MKPARCRDLVLRIVCFLSVAALLPAFAASVSALELEKLSVERWKELREVERYQLTIAEEYYNKDEWEVARSEYDKFLTLYERSEGAPFALYKWALCQLHLRHANTAIKEGFQSVIDYWPDSPDAIRSAYYIAKTYRAIGEVKKAKTAYAAVLEKHPDHLVAVHSLNDLIEITRIEEDVKKRVALWKKLAFETERNNREAARICAGAAHDLAYHQMSEGAVKEAVETLKQNYSDEKKIPYHLLYFGRSAHPNHCPIYHLCGNEETKTLGHKIADQTIAYIRTQIPADLSEEENKQLAKTFLYYVANVHGYARRPQEVPKVYDEIARRVGTDDGLLAKLADWYKGQDRWDDARATYRKFENKIEGENQVAYSYRQQNKIDEAVAVYRQLAAKDPENEAKWIGQAASTYKGGGKYAEAIAVYEELLKLDAGNADDYRWNIAECYESLGKQKEAIAWYRLHSNFAASRERMARCFRRLKEYDEAISLYRQVASASPGHAPEMMLQVGHTQKQAGRKEQAIKAYQLVCKNFPKNSQASDAHNILQNDYKITVTLGGGKKDN